MSQPPNWDRRNDYSRARTCSPGPLNSSSSSRPAPRTVLPPIQPPLSDPRYPSGMGTLHPPSRQYDDPYAPHNHHHHQPSSMFVDSRYSSWGPGGGSSHLSRSLALQQDASMSPAFQSSTPSYGLAEPRYPPMPVPLGLNTHSSGMHRPRPSHSYMHDSMPSAMQPRSSTLNYDYPPAATFAPQGRQLPPPFPIDTSVNNNSYYLTHQGSPPNDNNWASSPGSMASPVSPPSYGRTMDTSFVDGNAADPLVKKKRKRADARQLAILNEVYARTAFPSTEERRSLAIELDMTPRSVQIWFQNKRQANRQSRPQLSPSQQPPPTPPIMLQRPPSRLSPSSGASYSGSSGYGPNVYSRSPPLSSGFPNGSLESSRPRSLSREREYLPPLRR